MPLEARLIRSLRIWLRDPDAVLEDGRSVKRGIESLLEWYIGYCLSDGPEELDGWWCDGVIHLELHPTAAETIKLLGVCWVGRSGEGLAPFEIDVELDPASDRWFARTIFRIGLTDEQGRPKFFDKRRHTDYYVANRPRRNRDRAMAVELTPPDRPDEAEKPCE